MSWNFTPLCSGALPSDNYPWDISGLSANTEYAYRAYVIYDGIAYYGSNTLTGKTTICPTYVPSGVTTGGVIADIDSLSITGSCVVHNGGLPEVCGYEYGLLYTQNQLWSDKVKLLYENVPNVCKISTTGTTVMPYPYNNTISGLVSGTMTYFRAFAKNATGVGYGSVSCEATALPPSIGIDVSVVWNGSCSSYDEGFNGVYRLFHCDGTLVQSCNEGLYTCQSIASWNVPVGCYYVDFSGLEARCHGNAITYDSCWTDCNGSDYGYCTNCFSGDNNVYYQLPLAYI